MMSLNPYVYLVLDIAFNATNSKDVQEQIEYVKQELKNNQSVASTKFVEFKPNDQLNIYSLSIFNATFNQKFSKDEVNISTFQNEGKYEQAALIMNTILDTDFYEVDEFAALKIFFKNKDFLLIFLPTDKLGYEKLLRNMSHDKVLTVLSKMKPRRVNMSIPKIVSNTVRTTKTYSSDPDWDRLFSSKTSLVGVAKNKGVYLTDMKLVTSVDFSEIGVSISASTRKAALTAPAGRSSTNLVEFHCVHPFVYFIIAGNGTMPLFGGLITNM
ncbi:serpin B3-like isoform X1 [Leptotrombidium deliense]|uniref:Serpin B3-like isoform X1 n=1 Tax=Leptotrombidium deliense TaxID=299467 RepID=A0A443S058_9ACAR|nr:serpin B3-like isoform X1 [Leptotrombidium deliense]